MKLFNRVFITLILLSGGISSIVFYFHIHPIPKVNFFKATGSTAYFSDSAKFKNIKIYLIKTNGNRQKRKQYIIHLNQLGKYMFCSNTSTNCLTTHKYEQHIDLYYKQLTHQFKCRDSANGIAIFVNGKLLSLDIYNTHSICYAMMKQLILSGILEAISTENHLKPQFIKTPVISSSYCQIIYPSQTFLTRSCSKTQKQFYNIEAVPS